jgi:hypothetical protein
MLAKYWKLNKMREGEIFSCTGDLPPVIVPVAVLEFAHNFVVV